MRLRTIPQLAAVALALLLGAAAVAAQTAQADGTVKLKQADGSVTPVKDATVTFYRTDIQQKPISVKTGKDGRYVLLGIPFGAKYTITVSAPGAQPTFVNNVIVSRQPTMDFTLDPGNGGAITLEQALSTAAASAAPAAGDSKEAKAAAEEIKKKNEEIAAKNEKIKAANATVLRTFNAGRDALNAKNYDAAIAAADEGLQADPEQSALYEIKSVALRARGVDKYNTAVKAKDKAGQDAARNDFKAAADAGEQAVKYFRAMRASGNANATPAAETGVLFDRAEAYRLGLQTQSPVAPEDAVKALQEYAAAETDPAKKTRAEASIGDALFAAGRNDEAIAAFRQVLAVHPDNLDAMYGLGLALAADPNGAHAEEAKAIIQQFLAKAPANHPHRADATELIATLDAAIKAKTPEPATNADTGKKRRKS